MEEMTPKEKKRFDNFCKSKLGKLIELEQDVHIGIMPYQFPKPDPLSSLSSALWIIAKGTRYEESAKQIISDLCPEYFED